MGADRFLAFLRDELKPWVRERYGADPDDSMFFGDSRGGLFATYVLVTEPTTREGRLRRRRPRGPGRRRTLPRAAAARPTGRMGRRGYIPEDYVGYCERMVAALRSRGYPSLQIECEVLPGEYHETAPPLNLSRSVRYVFDAPR